MRDLFRIELIQPTHKNAMLGSITINSAKGEFQEFFMRRYHIGQSKIIFGNGAMH